MKTENILCERNYEGAWVVSSIIEGTRLHRVYYGYSKKYATSHFKVNPPK